MVRISIDAVRDAGKRTGLAFLASLWYCLASAIFFGSFRFVVAMTRFCIGTLLHPRDAIKQKLSNFPDAHIFAKDWDTLDDAPSPPQKSSGADSQHAELLHHGGAALYQGVVGHVRTSPVRHAFCYPVRYALVNIDLPPTWWARAEGGGEGEKRGVDVVASCDNKAAGVTAGGIDGKPHLSGDEARAVAGTDGPVLLLTIPTSLGYEQNPISIYFCYSASPTKADPSWPTTPWTPALGKSQPHASAGKKGGDPANTAAAAAPPPCALPLVRCIAEVTNTPWGERVVFPFAPYEDLLPKPLHVSPFQDMESCWRMQAHAPGAQLKVTITCAHPTMGDYFVARLQAGRVPSASMPPSHALPDPWFLGMPHRVAFWIYWHALLLWWKGVRFLSHPKYTDGDAYRGRVLDKEAKMKRERGACPASRVPTLPSGTMACPVSAKDGAHVATAKGAMCGAMACPVSGTKGGVATGKACGGANGLGPLPPIRYRDARAYPWL
eukprot:jgi/Mesvir1/16371/Mv18118-RA.1